MGWRNMKITNFEPANQFVKRNYAGSWKLELIIILKSNFDRYVILSDPRYKNKVRNRYYIENSTKNEK